MSGDDTKSDTFKRKEIDSTSGYELLAVRTGSS